MRIRNAFVWLHRYLGLTILAFLIVAGVTGSVLVFREPLDAAFNSDLSAIPAGGHVLAPARVADIVQRTHPEWRITEAPLRLKPDEAMMLAVAPATPGAALGFNQVFVDPHDGHVIGTRENRPGWGRRHIMEGILQFHQNLLASTIGRWFMGIVAIGWLISNLVGLYLTFPTLGPFWQRWGKIWLIRRGTRFPRFCLDLHRAGGLWLFLGFLILAITSVEMNFYDELFVPAVNAIWAPAPSPFDAGASIAPKGHQAARNFEESLAAAKPLAARSHPGWVPVFTTYSPRLGLYGVSFIPRSADTYSRLGPAAYYFNDVTGAFVYRDDPYEEGARGAIMRSLYPLHSGRIWGWPTRILAFVLGLATAILSLTGLYVWWRKR